MAHGGSLSITDDGETGLAHHYCLFQSVARLLLPHCCRFGPGLCGLLLDLSSRLGRSLQIGLVLLVCVGLRSRFAEGDLVLLLSEHLLPDFCFPHCPFSRLLFFSGIAVFRIILGGDGNSLSMHFFGRFLLGLGLWLRLNDFVAAGLHHTASEDGVG